MSSSLTKLLAQATELTIPHINFINRWYLQQDIIDTIENYNCLIFGSDTSICQQCLNDLRKEQLTDEKIVVGEFHSVNEFLYGKYNWTWREINERKHGRGYWSSCWLKPIVNC